MTIRRPLLPRAAAAVLAAAALLALLAPAAAGAPPAVVVRVFALKHRAADEALQLVRPLLSDAGSVMLEPKANELTVRDTAASVERAAQAIAAYDVPLRGVDVAVTLLKATSDPKAAPSMTDASAEIRGIGERLKKLFNVTDFTRLDSVVVRGIEGQRVAYAIGSDVPPPVRPRPVARRQAPAVPGPLARAGAPRGRQGDARRDPPHVDQREHGPAVHPRRGQGRGGARARSSSSSTPSGPGRARGSS